MLILKVFQNKVVRVLTILFFISLAFFLVVLGFVIFEINAYPDAVIAKVTQEFAEHTETITPFNAVAKKTQYRYTYQYEYNGETVEWTTEKVPILDKVASGESVVVLINPSNPTDCAFSVKNLWLFTIFILAMHLVFLLFGVCCEYACLKDKEEKAQEHNVEKKK